MNDKASAIGPKDRTVPIRDLGLTIEGSRLAPIVAEFERELVAAGLSRVMPTLYLSTEWGVPDGTLAIAIPFYLARADLASFHVERTGHLEGRSAADILRYLRHEMGHVVNYAYRLYEMADWSRLFGPITRPYDEEYRPEPFSREFVRHLPGWYAQKHPDEDWSETFAVWLTPDRDWRAEYAEWPRALEKLAYCDRVVRDLGQRDPPCSSHERDEDISEIAYTLDDYYDALDELGEPLPPGVDAALRSIFEDLGEPEPGAPADAPRRLASALIDQCAGDLAAEVFRWTGHFPERTRPLLRHLAERADDLTQVYPESRENGAIVGLTALVTTLATNHVRLGRYLL